MHDFGGPGAVDLGLVGLVAGAHRKGPRGLGLDSGPYEVPGGVGKRNSGSDQAADIRRPHAEIACSSAAWARSQRRCGAGSPASCSHSAQNRGP